jgi:hypothetical protein
MLIPLLVVNALTLVAALHLLRCLARPIAPDGPSASFAHVLAGATPGIEPAAPPAGMPPGLAPEAVFRPGRIPPSSTPTGGDEALAASQLSLADRLAVIRHMLQGRSIEETAARVRVPADAVRTLYLQHGRREGTPC